MINAAKLIEKLKQGDFRSLARAITLVENEVPGYEEILQNLEIDTSIPLIGITGPPGSGKSTLVNGLISIFVKKGLKIGVIAVDPTSPFNHGSLLGDRVRMSGHFLDTNVYIRSLATRGALGGLSAKAIEISDLFRASGFGLVLIETVGVGQSEVEIAGLASTSIVVLVPEAGDEIQGIKSGLMEIADIFVVNKADREGAALFANNLLKLVKDARHSGQTIPVLQTVASQNEGLEKLVQAIEKHHSIEKKPDQHAMLLAERAYELIRNERMKDVDKQALQKELAAASVKPGFNLYTFVKRYK